jgi:hypothetical protein
MKWIGEKISYKDHGSYFTMIITGKTEKWKFNLIVAWAIAWAFSGAAVVYMLFFDEKMQAELLYYLAFLGFWVYFFYKIIRVLLWRKFGMEYLKIDEDRLTLKKSVWGYGKSKDFLLENLKSFDQEKLKEKSYAKVFNDSFWVLGEGTLVLSTNNKVINFGSQISPKDGKAIVKVLNKQLKNFKSTR